MRLQVPDKIGLSYAKSLESLYARVTKELFALLQKELKRGGTEAEIIERVLRLLSTNAVSQLAAQFFARTERFHRVQLSKVLAIDLFEDVVLTNKARAFIAENVSLIKNNSQTFADDLAPRVLNAVREGTPWKHLVPELQERFAITKRHARLIARDQIGKAYNDINQARQEEAGVTEYIWRTAQDPRVRDAHAHREGKRFSWNDSPNGGHPGQAILCRCYAEPVLPDD